MFGIDGNLLSRQYKNHISDYRQWNQLPNARESVLFKQNLGSVVSMNETCLSQGVLAAQAITSRNSQLC